MIHHVGGFRRCQYEFASTVKLKGPDSLHMIWRSGGIKQLIDKVPKIHVEDAGFHLKEDRERILTDILRDFGSYDYFDTLLQLLLLLEPLDYSADLGALRAQGAASIWNLQHVVDWASRGVSTGGRREALGIFGEAGEGKSTLSALAVDPASGVNVHVSSRKLFVTVVRQMIRSPFQAWHFCKHNDQRRHDVLRIIKTLAFQLGTCKALPELWNGATFACFCDVYTPP